MPGDTTFLQINPVLPVDNMMKTIAFYEDKLGFKKIMDSSKYGEEPINYAVVCRNNVCIHFELLERIDDIKMPQFRIQVEDIAPLFDEYKSRGLLGASATLRNTPWATREFAFFDINGVGLTFFESLE
jgi:catechol 2,3-dioxygenase-like lactoylglutathione lyase family enzyme